MQWVSYPNTILYHTQNTIAFCNTNVLEQSDNIIRVLRTHNLTKYHKIAIETNLKQEVLPATQKHYYITLENGMHSVL